MAYVRKKGNQLAVVQGSRNQGGPLDRKPFGRIMEMESWAFAQEQGAHFEHLLPRFAST